ncbi:retrovirus-related pol polyprotein from transposon TNT 1-94, partial [Tanacetum coccineum]
FVKMETLFDSLDVFDVVENTFEESDDTQKSTEEQMKEVKQKRSQNAAVLRDDTSLRQGDRECIPIQLARKFSSKNGKRSSCTSERKSVGQLVEHGYSVIFEGKGCSIYNKGRNKESMQKIIMGRNRSFPITFRYEEHTVLKATTADEALLWHRRLGHLNFQSLNSIHQKNMVGGGLPQIYEIEGVYEGCALGKHHWKPFPKGVAWRAKEILELVHTDLCGPMRNPSHEPKSLEEAIREESWKKAMDDEIQFIKKNNTWELTDRPSDKDVIGVKWVYKVKFNADCSAQRNKARLVAKGYSKQPRIDYDETFSLVARVDTVRAIISLAGPESKSEPTLYGKNQGTSDILIVALYVDDLLFIRNNKKMIKDFKNEMTQKYEMSGLGLLNHFLGIEIYQDEGGVFICQEKYVEKILKIFDMSECKPKDTPLLVNKKLMKEDGSSKVDSTLYRSLV